MFTFGDVAELMRYMAVDTTSANLADTLNDIADFIESKYDVEADASDCVGRIIH